MTFEKTALLEKSTFQHPLNVLRIRAQGSPCVAAVYRQTASSDMSNLAGRPILVRVEAPALPILLRYAKNWVCHQETFYFKEEGSVASPPRQQRPAAWRMCTEGAPADSCPTFYCTCTVHYIVELNWQYALKVFISEKKHNSAQSIL